MKPKKIKAGVYFHLKIISTGASISTRQSIYWVTTLLKRRENTALSKCSVSTTRAVVILWKGFSSSTAAVAAAVVVASAAKK